MPRRSAIGPLSRSLDAVWDGLSSAFILILRRQRAAPTFRDSNPRHPADRKAIVGSSAEEAILPLGMTRNGLVLEPKRPLPSKSSAEFAIAGKGRRLRYGRILYKTNSAAAGFAY